MGKKCVKCGHARELDDGLNPDACPACGAIYAKVEAALEMGRNVRTARPGASARQAASRPVSSLTSGSASVDPKKTKDCPYCAETILAAAVKCKHCGSDLNGDRGNRPSSQQSVDHGVPLILVPLAGAVLIWVWVGNMALINSPASWLGLITAIVTIATAVLAYRESNAAESENGRPDGAPSPVSWLIIIILVWLFTYPAYMYKRAAYGLKGMLTIGLIVALFYAGSAYGILAAIEEQQAEIQRNLADIERQQRDALRDFEREMEKLNSY